MSNKIDVFSISVRHFKYALKDSRETAVSARDVTTFLAFPACLSFAVWWFDLYKLEGVVGSYVTVCAIFAGLLLNLLVLVYDQSRSNQAEVNALEKLVAEQNEKDDSYSTLDEATACSRAMRAEDVNPTLYVKRNVLSQLVDNISYAVIVSLLTIFLCMISMFFSDPISFSVRQFLVSFSVSNALFSISTFFMLNLFLTLLMIIKRVHRLIN